MATSDKTEKAQPFRFDYGAIIKKVEKEFSLIESSPSTERMQTGVFVLDLIHGGGIPPGRMITLAGKESCGKSTTLMTALRTAAHYENLGFINYWDYEGSFDRTYLSQMLNDDKIAKIVDEKLRVWPKNHGEDFFNAQGEILRALPDKKFLDGKWYLCFPRTKEYISTFAEGSGNKYNREYLTKYDMYCVESDESPQGIIFVDSWPAMTPKALDEVDPSNAVGASARMFSDNLKKVVGKLEEKRVILLGVNQLRDKPMDMYNPVYEPGGNSLLFYSSIRTWQSPRVNGPDQQNLTDHTKGVHQERSIFLDMDTGEDRMDYYRYIFFENRKNKTATPYVTGWGRLWIRDNEGKARGWCPVFDAWWYLLMTGQVNGKMKQFSINFHELQFDKMSWFDFKKLILLKGEALQEHCAKLNITQPPRIRERIATQIREGSFKINPSVA